MMKWKELAFGIAVIVILLKMAEGQGRWVGQIANNKDWYYLIDNGVDVMPKKSLVFALKACQGGELLFTEKHAVKKYVYVRLGDKSNGDEQHHTFANSHCASGSCTYGDKVIKPLLNCTKYIPFWAQWDNLGKFQMGLGLVIGGSQPLLRMDYGEAFELRLVKVSMTTTDQGTWLMNIDNAPSFSSPSPYANSSVDVNEDISIGQEIASLAASDPEGNDVTFAVVGDDADVFVCNGTSLKTNQALDYETKRSYYLTIAVKDERLSTVASLAVNVVNVIDEAPSIIPSSNILMPEELLKGTSLSGFYLISDRDVNDTLTYSISGPDSSSFTVNPDTGALVVATRVDRDHADGQKELHITLNVEDSGSLKTVSDIVITVLDVNDNPPSFSQPRYFTEVKENAGDGLKLLQLECTDDDDGVNGDIFLSIEAGDDAEPHFYLSGQALYVNANAVDYESLGNKDFTYYLTIKCADRPQEGNTYTDLTVATIKILPDNEDTPVWESPVTNGAGAFPEVSYDEDVAPSTTIQTFVAKDNDLGQDGSISYEIISVTADDGSSNMKSFSLNRTNGILRTASYFDRDTATGGFHYFDIVVMATDDGTPHKSVTGTLRFNLNNVNDNFPQFDKSFYDVTIPEDTSPGDMVTTVTPRDHDGDTVTLSIAGDWTDTFSISGHSVILSKALDYEVTRCLTTIISATDGVHITNATLSVEVTNVMDETPEITVYKPLIMHEELPIGTVIGGVFTVRDDDQNDPLTYSLEGNDSQYFNINSTTGALSIKKTIDADGTGGYSTLSQLTLVVQDSAGLSDRKDLIFTVTDVNDNNPHCSQDVYIVNVTENTAANELLLEFNCSDADPGNNGNVRLSLDGGNSDNCFKMEGMALYTDSVPVDYEGTSPIHTIILTILAQDSPQSGLPRLDVAVVIVQVLPQNEFSPEWASPKTDSNNEFPALRISEATLPGSNITQFTATDNDHGVDGVVTYETLSQVSAKGNSAEVFTIDKESGILRVASNLDADSATGGVDYYNVTIRAIDGGTNPLSTTGVITIQLTNVNDNAPDLTNHEDTVEVPEDTAVGSIVHTITASDHDGDSIALSVVSGDLEYFTGDANQIKTLKTLDYESRHCYTVVISMTDGKYTKNVTLTITVTDVNDEAPVLHVYDPLTIPEELPVGTVTGTAFYATDADKDDVLMYTLSGKDSKYFNLNTTTGLLSVKERIDLEGSSAVTSPLEITVIVEDKGGLTNTANLSFTVLDLNDNFPTFLQSVYRLNITEETAVSAEILQLDCTDDDSGTNGQITLSVSSGDSNNVFTISGLKLFVNVTQVDYESMADQDYRYTLTIEAVDTPNTGPARTGVTLVIVQVLPLNEFAPVWTSPAFNTSSNSFTTLIIKEDLSVGVGITKFMAEDEDMGADGDVVYSIIYTTDNNGVRSSESFIMDSSTGTLRVASPLDRDVPSGGVTYYDVIVSATDSGSFVNSVAGTIQIILENVNDNAPMLDSDSDSVVNVSEDTPVGNVVQMLSPVDYDGDDVSVTVVGGDTYYFTVDGNNITLTNVLDFEKQQCHIIIVSLCDGMHTVNLTLTFVVVNINKAPAIHVYSDLTVSEELPIGTVVGGAFYVIDDDVNNSHTYTLSGKDSKYFNLNTTTGLLSVKERIDLEGSSAVTSPLEITVIVEDKGGLTDTANLSFTVLDVNDNFPTFSQSVYTVNVNESTRITDVLIQFHCVDEDSGTNGQFTLSVTSGDSNNVFTTSGLKLFVNATQVDYESMADQDYRYTLTIEAVDTPNTGPARTGVTLVIIQVTPLNEFSPVWTRPSFDTASKRFPDERVKEDASPGLNITTFTATDADHGPDGDIIYRILSTVDSTGKNITDVFMIGLHTGTLHLATTLDSDVATGGVDNYTVVVVAVDGGSEQQSVTGTVIIHLENVNDNPPTVDEFHASVVVSEAAVVGDVVSSLNTVDYDDGDTVSTAIVDGDVEFFTMDANDIRITKLLDYESAQCHSVVIKLSDGKHDQNVTVTIHVTDVNDNSPVLTVYTPVRLPEEQPVGTTVCGVFSVADADTNDILKFHLSGSKASYFSINSTSGILSINDVIDRDGSSGISTIDDVILTVTDAAGHNTSKALIFEIQDLNDNTPVFSKWVYIINATEGKTVKDPLLIFDITYADTGNNAEIIVSISDGDDLDPAFNVSGKQLYVDGNKLDYETLKHTEYRYLLRVTVTDNPVRGPPRRSYAMVIVMILPQNEFTPVWTNPVVDAGGLFPSVTIRENISLGSTIATFSATDEDHGEDGIVQYDIVSIIADSGVNETGKFQIDANTGILHTTDNLDSDRPTGGVAFYDVKIKASDNGNPRKETVGTLRIHIENVNDNKPQFQVRMANIDVAEDAAVGQSVYSVTATDADGDEVHYSVVGSDMLMVDGVDVKIQRQFHYETDKCMSFIISASDTDYDTNMTLIVRVMDVADEPPRLEAGVTWISEEIPVGRVVCGLYTMTDADRNDKHTYTLEGSDVKYFNINTTSGVMTIAERIDRDGTSGTTSITDLKLTVTDASGLKDSIYLNVTIQDINDNAPVFSQAIYHANLTENEPQNSVIVTFLLTDIDDGTNDDLLLSIRDGDGQKSQFKIDGFNLVTTSRNIGYESREEQDYKFIMEVIAVDQPKSGDQRTATTIVIVTILPLNEKTPVWKVPTTDNSGRFPDIRILENIAAGSTVSTFEATDDDKGFDGIITYHLISVTTDTGSVVENKFSLDLESGVLRTVGYLDRDVDTGGVEFYDVILEARDSNPSPRTAEGTIRILLDNVNDNPPFLDCLHVVHVKEDISVGETILTLPEYDADHDAVTFTVRYTDMFRMPSGTSEVKVVKDLDFETQISHTAILSATDGKHVVNSTLIMMVVDVNDEPPEITVKSIAIPEELPPGTEVCGAFAVSDKDRGDVLRFHTEGAQSDYFNINSSSGDLTVAKYIDRDGHAGVTLMNNILLTVTDDVGHNSTVTLNIAITDINDNSPLCSVDVVNITVTENSQDKQYLTTINCTDADFGSNGETEVSVSDGNNGGVFYMDGMKLCVNGSGVDYERLPDHVYALVIEATDLPERGHVHTTAVLVSVRILPVNEHDPEWKDPVTDDMDMFPDVTVREDLSPGVEILKLSGIDSDDGSDGDLHYNIQSATSSGGKDSTNMFHMDRLTGSLTSINSLDADVETGGVDFHTIILEARDLGSSPRSVTGTVKILLEATNDNPPVFSKPVFNVYISCDVEPKTEISKLTAHDADGDSDMLFTISSGASNVIDVNQSTGSVVLKTVPQFESASDRVTTIKVLVRDAENEEFSDEAHLTVVFEDCAPSTVRTTQTPVQCVPDMNDIVSDWVLRSLLVVFGVALLAVLSVYMKTKLCPTNVIGDFKVPKKPKAAWGEDSIERPESFEKTLPIYDVVLEDDPSMLKVKR